VASTHLRVESLDSLRRRAHAYFERVRRPVPADELADVLFAPASGASGVAPLLIRALLGRDDRFRQSPRGRWELAKHLYRNVPLQEASFAVVDVEATGSHPVRDRVIEVGIVRIERLRIVEEFDTLIDPGVEVPLPIRRLTGIDGPMLKGAPSLGEVAPRLVRLLDDAVFVAHNSEFDYRFLHARLGALEFRMAPAPRLCTMRLAQRRLPQLSSCGLDVVSRHYDVSLVRRHRAKDDARATAEILLRLVEDASQDGVLTVGQLLEQQRGRS
jgi:DNA polymerase III epsilon subunit family exonuclease